MTDTTTFPESWHTKRDEAEAFKDYAPFRYGEVAMDPDDLKRVNATRKHLDPILVETHQLVAHFAKRLG